MAKGLQSEKRIQKYFEDKGFQLVQARKKTPFGEIDLWMQSTNQKFLAVEVKTTQDFGFLGGRIAPLQRSRLRRTWQFVLERYPGTPYLVAFVPPTGIPLILHLSEI